MRDTAHLEADMAFLLDKASQHLTEDEHRALAVRLVDTDFHEPDPHKQRQNLAMLTDMAIKHSREHRLLLAFIQSQLGEPTEEPGHWNCRLADLQQVSGTWICETDVPWCVFTQVIPENGVIKLTVDWNDSCTDADKARLLAVVGYAVLERIYLITPLIDFESYNVPKWHLDVRGREIHLGALVMGGTYTAHGLADATDNDDWNLMMEHIWPEHLKALGLDQEVNLIGGGQTETSPVSFPDHPRTSATGTPSDPAELLRLLRQRTK